MSKYQDLRIQIKRLEVEAEQVRKAELAEVISSLKSQIKQYGLTPADLGFKGTFKGVKPANTVGAKYRDPQTGATWTGRGKPPHWASAAKKAGKLDSLAINAAPAPAVPTPAPAKSSKPAASTKAPVKSSLKSSAKAKASPTKAKAKPASKTRPKAA